MERGQIHVILHNRCAGKRVVLTFCSGRMPRTFLSGLSVVCVCVYVRHVYVCIYMYVMCMYVCTCICVCVLCSYRGTHGPMPRKQQGLRLISLALGKNVTHIHGSPILHN